MRSRRSRRRCLRTQRDTVAASAATDAATSAAISAATSAAASAATSAAATAIASATASAIARAIASAATGIARAKMISTSIGRAASCRRAERANIRHNCSHPMERLVRVMTQILH